MTLSDMEPTMLEMELTNEKTELEAEIERLREALEQIEQGREADQYMDRQEMCSLATTALKGEGDGPR